VGQTPQCKRVDPSIDSRQRQLSPQHRLVSNRTRRRAAQTTDLRCAARKQQKRSLVCRVQTGFTSAFSSNTPRPSQQRC